MNNVARMNVVDSKAHVDEDFPKKVVREQFPFLLLYSGAQVSILAVLHNYADGLFSYEGVVVANNKMTVNFRHNFNFLHCLESSILVQP
jgi:hypothetical protein